MPHPRIRCPWLPAAALLGSMLVAWPSAAIRPAVVAGAASADDILARSRAVYAALRSYADTGHVEHEFGPSSAPGRERHTFATHYRAPRHFRFDYTKHKDADRYVVWSDEEKFYTWWRSGGVEQVFPKGQGAGAFTGMVAQTSKAVSQIASLLFAQAGLDSTLTELADASLAGTEEIQGRPCHKLVGVARSVYRMTGHETNVRRTTVWIDTETLLVRRIYEDTPRGTVAGMLNRYTTTFDPQPNPDLQDAIFRFVPPSGGR